MIKGNSGDRKNLSISVTDNLYIRSKLLLSMPLLTFLSQQWVKLFCLAS